MPWLIKEKMHVIGWSFRQTKDVLKLLKKRLGSKIPKVQLLALFVSDSLCLISLLFLKKFYAITRGMHIIFYQNVVISSSIY